MSCARGRATARWSCVGRDLQPLARLSASCVAAQPPPCHRYCLHRRYREHRPPRASTASATVVLRVVMLHSAPPSLFAERHARRPARRCRHHIAVAAIAAGVAAVAAVAAVATLSSLSTQQLTTQDSLARPCISSQKCTVKSQMATNAAPVEVGFDQPEIGDGPRTVSPNLTSSALCTPLFAGRGGLARRKA
mgnify:CR=1 FL=1